MGCWGMGMAQSDEFCENYDNFMEEYDNGKAVAEITADILAKYHAEFADDDGVMHDIYFALAKAEWMCCEQSELVLRRVREIIESGANVVLVLLILLLVLEHLLRIDEVLLRLQIVRSSDQ